MLNKNYQNIPLAFSVPVTGYARQNLLLNKLNSLRNKKGAFTLAETLITLTIIGVIAAITVPTLVSNYTKQTYVVGLKKAYSQLSNAMRMIPLTEGCSSGDLHCAGWNDNSAVDGIEYRDNKRPYILSKQFKVQKFCHMQEGIGLNMDECFPPEKYPNRNEVIPGYGAFITEDGITYVSSSGFTIGNNYDYMAGLYLYVDVNGIKGPNKRGRDIFGFYIIGEEVNGLPSGAVIPNGSALTGKIWGGSPENWKINCNNSNNNNWTKVQCTARVLEEGKMNY